MFSTKEGYIQGQIDDLRAENEALRRDAELANDTFAQIVNWCRAYPLSVFPEPDFKKAHAVLLTEGITLDAISASNMRHVLKGVEQIIIGAQGVAMQPMTGTSAEQSKP